MEKSKKIPLIALAITLVFVILFTGYFVRKNQGDNELILYGNIDIRQAELGFRVFGKLKKMYVEEGDKVSPGDLLAEIDSIPYENSLKEAEGRLSSIENNLTYSDAQLERRNLLVKGKSVSEEDYQQAYYNQKVLSSNLEEAKAAFSNAKVRLEDTKLFAPSDGVIFTRVREPGTILNVGDPVYVLSVSSPIWARSYISETNLGRVHPGMAAEVYTDTSSNPVYKGHIGFISPVAEFTPKNVETPDLRTDLVYQLRIVIDNPDNGLRQGMPVTIKFPQDNG
jgi:HlyD family secretion protein